MTYFLEKPLEQLQETLDKLNRIHKDCHPYDYTECDYIASQVTDRDAFMQAINNAIKNIELASQYTK